MSRLSKIRARKRLIDKVDYVKLDNVIAEMSKNTNDVDLYKFFVTQNAFNTGVLEENVLNDLAMKVYCDWYFLHKNTTNTPQMVKLLGDYEYAPINLTNNKCWGLITSEKFKGVLPVFLQYINKMQEEFFLCVKIDELYNNHFDNVNYPVRLYLNLKIDKAYDFAKEFIYKSYLYEFPALLKLLNNDKRNDTITIYTDYDYAETIISLIEEIKKDNPKIFDGIGKNCCLLGTINGYIGFGEELEDKNTFIYSRTKVLDSLDKSAKQETLQSLIVAEEKQIINKGENSYTVTDYLKVLINEIASELLTEKIYQETHVDKDSEKLQTLLSIKGNLNNIIDVDKEVDGLKRAICRNVDYHLSIDNVGQDDYNYVLKLYRLFGGKREYNKQNKLDILLYIESVLYRMTDTICNEKTSDVMYDYFKTELIDILQKTIDEELQSIEENKQNNVVVNFKKNQISKLQKILNSIIDDCDDGKKYVRLGVFDYLRILSLGLDEKVEFLINGRLFVIDKNIGEDLLNLMPDVADNIKKLSVSNEYVDKKLQLNGINSQNMCLCVDDEFNDNVSHNEDVDREQIVEYGVLYEDNSNRSNYSYTDNQYLSNAMV